MAVDSGKTTGTEFYFLLISLLLAPALILYFTLDHFERQKNYRLLESAKQKLMEPLNQIKKYKDIEAFWCVTLNEQLAKSANPDEMAERIEQLAVITGEKLNYIIWQNKNHIQRSNFLVPAELKNWQNLIKDVKTAYKNRDSAERPKIESEIRKLLGPHYLAEHYSRPQNIVDPRFIRADNAQRYPFVWLNNKLSLPAVVLFQPDILKRDHRLKLLSNNWKGTKHRLQYLDLGKQTSLVHGGDLALKVACYEFVEHGKEISQFANRLIGVARVSPTSFVANNIFVDDYTNHSGRNALFLTLLTVFVLIMTFRSRPDFLQPDNISIRLQLLTLLFICSGLPLLSLTLGALEHLKQQRDYLTRSAYQTCLNYIQAMDRRSSGELSQVMMLSRLAVEEFTRLYRNGAAEEEIIKRTFDLMHTSKNEFRAAASSSNYLLANDGSHRNGIFNQYIYGKSRKLSKTPIEIRAVNDIGAYLLSFLNHTSIDSDSYREIELFTEMFYHKNLTEVVHELLLIIGNIAPMGWGSTSFPVFLEVISIYNPKIADFFFMAAYNPDQINNAFIRRQADNLRRNEFGLNVFLFDDFSVYPIDYDRKNEELISIFARTGIHPALEPQICSYDGDTWIFAGCKGNLLGNFKIIALYPMSGVDKAIEKERWFIVYSALAAFVILVSLTLLFGHNFTVPVSYLQAAAGAVEKRAFGFQLPDLGRDEFGEMGRVFNKSIAELEELAIASIVQNHLMPAKTIDSGRFDVFGRSVPMAELGGDYYDYFSISQERFAVLLGDVAGHGVGASLIMAMAKSTIVCCSQWHDQPVRMLENLHRLISTTRSRKQRKIMTFQYLCLDKISGVGKYANAGACSPILVCPEAATAKEVNLPGPVLGGFKKSKFSEIELQIPPGAALVFYTDGIIEAKNAQGAEIGYERFKEWLLKHYNIDAAAYYRAVYNEYLQWLAGGDAEDDLTLIVMVHKKYQSAT